MLRSAWRSLLHHKLRLVLSGVAIVLGVGFVVGTLIFTDTLNSTFTNLFADTTSDVVVTPEKDVGGRGFAGTVATLPAATLADIQAVAGVAKAGGQVLADGVAIVDREGQVLGTTGAPTFGSNWEDDQELTPFRLEEGRGPAAPGEVALDSVSAEKAGYVVGDTIPMVGPDGPLAASLVGIFRYGTSGNLAGATIAARARGRRPTSSSAPSPASSWSTRSSPQTATPMSAPPSSTVEVALRSNRPLLPIRPRWPSMVVAARLKGTWAIIQTFC